MRPSPGAAISEQEQVTFAPSFLRNRLVLRPRTGALHPQSARPRPRALPFLKLRSTKRPKNAKL